MTMPMGRSASFTSVLLTDTELLGPNPKRFALMIGSPVANRVTLSFGGPAVLDQGVNLYAGGPPLFLVWDHLGNSMREEVRAISTVANATIGVVDWFWL